MDLDQVRLPPDSSNYIENPISQSPCQDPISVPTYIQNQYPKEIMNRIKMHSCSKEFRNYPFSVLFFFYMHLLYPLIYFAVSSLGITQVTGSFCNLKDFYLLKVNSLWVYHELITLSSVLISEKIKNRNCKQAKFCKGLNFHLLTQKYLVNINAHLFTWLGWKGTCILVLELVITKFKIGKH